jgi:hypothetical protein
VLLPIPMSSTDSATAVTNLFAFAEHDIAPPINGDCLHRHSVLPEEDDPLIKCVKCCNALDVAQVSIAPESVRWKNGQEPKELLSSGLSSE